MLWDRRQRQDEIPQLCRFGGGGRAGKEEAEEEEDKQCHTEHVMSVFYADPGPKMCQVKMTFLPVRVQCKCAAVTNAHTMQCNASAL